MKHLLILALVVISMGNSCKKDIHDISFKEGTILDGGPQAADGCGWLIRVDSISYSPVNLQDDLRKHGQKIRIRFEILDEKFDCGYRYQTSYSKMKILQIRATP